jgi:hypothetical protein
VADNSGPIFIFIFFQFWLPKNTFKHGWKLFVSPSNHLGGFPSGYYNVNVLQQHTFKEKNHIVCLPQV